jgi:hypothetical protein
MTTVQFPFGSSYKRADTVAEIKNLLAATNSACSVELSYETILQPVEVGGSRWPQVLQGDLQGEPEVNAGIF